MRKQVICDPSSWDDGEERNILTEDTTCLSGFGFCTPASCSIACFFSATSPRGLPHFLGRGEAVHFLVSIFFIFKDTRHPCLYNSIECPDGRNPCAWRRRNCRRRLRPSDQSCSETLELSFPSGKSWCLPWRSSGLHDDAKPGATWIQDGTGMGLVSGRS